MPYEKTSRKAAIFTGIRLWLLYIIVASIVFSQLWINSVSILAFVAVFLVEGNYLEKWRRIRNDRVVWAYCLYFALELVGLLSAKNFATGWKYTESKAAFLAMPIIFCSAGFVDVKFRNKVLLALNIAVTVASLYCLVIATRNYYNTGAADVFFYHQLVSPLKHHAVYFSVFIFISFVFLLQEGHNMAVLKNNKWLILLWIIFYVVLLMLLSSKMVLLILVLYLIYAIFRRYLDGKGRKTAAVLAFVLTGILICVFTLDNPVKKRFDDVLHGNVSIVEQQKYDQTAYFNGLQFRLLLWRLTFEILHDNNKWIIGVGPANSQAALQEKYRSLNMYTGHSGSDNHGYLDFNAHNQFLQTALASGIVGLLVLISWCIVLVAAAFEKRSPLLAATVFILLCFFFSESVFERQYGVILCTVFPLLMIYTKEEDPPKLNTPS